MLGFSSRLQGGHPRMRLHTHGMPHPCMARISYTPMHIIYPPPMYMIYAPSMHATHGLVRLTCLTCGVSSWSGSATDPLSHSGLLQHSTATCSPFSGHLRTVQRTLHDHYTTRNHQPSTLLDLSCDDRALVMQGDAAKLIGVPTCGLNTTRFDCHAGRCSEEGPRGRSE